MALRVIIFGCWLQFLAGLLAVGSSDVLLLDLSGQHRFQRGDHEEWQKPSFDDSEWELATIPGTWQHQGIADVCDTGWYRIRFSAERIPLQAELALSIGFVGNVTEANLNGSRLGAIGSFDPIFSPPSRTFHYYPIPSSLLRAKETNLLALRVFNQAGAGGVIKGPFGINDLARTKLIAAAALAPREWITWIIATILWSLWTLLTFTIMRTRIAAPFRWTWLYTSGPRGQPSKIKFGPISFVQLAQHSRVS